MDPFIGEIRLFACAFEPKGWKFCSGEILSVSDSNYKPLFSVIGSTYGGNGISEFALPHLNDNLYRPTNKNNIAIGFGTGPGKTYLLGEQTGSENVTLTLNQVPAHSHTVACFTQDRDGGLSNLPTGNILAPSGRDSSYLLYADDKKQLNFMSLASIGFTGGGTAHNNMSPYLALNYCIAYEGAYPEKSAPL